MQDILWKQNSQKSQISQSVKNNVFPCGVVVAVAHKSFLANRNVKNVKFVIAIVRGSDVVTHIQFTCCLKVFADVCESKPWYLKHCCHL